MKSTFLSLLTAFFAIQINYAQQQVNISKQEVLNKVNKNSLALKIAEKNYRQARADFNQANAIFLPNITASHTGMVTTNPLMAFGSSLNQEILTQASFNPDLLNNPKATNNFATKIEIQQPLLNVDGLYQRKAAKYKMQATELQGKRTQDYLTLEVQKAYMQLQLAYKGVSVLEKALKTAQANQQIANNSFEQGYLQKADILMVEVRVGEIKNQLQTAKSNVKNASGYLSFLMNTSQNVQYVPSDSLQVITISSKAYNLSNNRSDFKAMEFATEGYKKMYQANTMSYLPRLNAFGSYELYDDKIFNADANGYLVGVQLSWDIFKGYKRIGATQKSKATYEKSQLEYEQYKAKSTMELNNAKRQLIDAEKHLALAKLALTQSEESLRIRSNRFKEGLEKTSDVLQAETMYAQKQLSYYQTVFQYNFTQAYLSFLTK